MSSTQPQEIIVFSLPNYEPWFQYDRTRSPENWRQCGYGALIEATTLVRKPGVVRLRVGYDNEQIKDAVYNKFHDVYENCTKENANSVDFDCKSKDEFDEIVKSVIEFLEAFKLLHKKKVSLNRTSDEGYYAVKAATVINACANGDWDVLGRAGMGFDSHDNLMGIGHSVAALSQAANSQDSEGQYWREHLVPCCIVIEEAIRMAKAGASAPAIAQMLKTNLAIMIITKEEQVRLDSHYKTTMPKDWKFGDSVFARLDTVGIRY